jgi:hypothetical protein
MELHGRRDNRRRNQQAPRRAANGRDIELPTAHQ